MNLENSSRNKAENSGILLLAKQSGETSFSSLSVVKKSLSTGKVGHTGTLDSFADGLLVVLAGAVTRLVPHITNFDKTYLALVEFGSETDTLDPTGKIVCTGRVPEKSEVENALLRFQGEQMQVPPVFSALNVAGRRASDIIRSGESVELPPRKIKVHSIKLLDFREKYALLEVTCSKGTYVRALARDIAHELGTVAHLKNLRRTRVGPFELKDAAGFSELKEFSIESLLKKTEIEFYRRIDDIQFRETVKKSLLPVTPKIAEFCGFESALLTSSAVSDFLNGRAVKTSSLVFRRPFPETCEIAVFYPDMRFAGVLKKNGNRLKYGFVIPAVFGITVYSWEQILSSKFSKDFFAAGSALAIGSFDGYHLGHGAIFDSVLKNEGRAKGIVTFTQSTRKVKSADTYPGDVSTLSQRLDFFMRKGFDFVILIDFSADFIKISGDEFFSILKNKCNLKYIAEGDDFKCGHKGSFDIPAIRIFCEKNDIELDVVSSVYYRDKKVSSSRIRQEISEAKFGDVAEMLREPYEIDCTGFEWENSAVGGGRCLTSKIQGTQVFPPDGEYSVLVKTAISGSEEISDTVSAVCKLDSGLLRVLVSDGFFREFVRAIQFCQSREINI